MTPQEALERAREIQRNNKLVQLRVSDEFFAQIFEAARQDRRSVAQFCRLAIEERIDREHVKRSARIADRLMEGQS